MGKTVTLQELADVTGYTVQTLIRWQKNEEMPVLLSGQRGRGNQYDTAEVIAWMIQRKVSELQLESPRDRLDRIRADREELALEKDLDSVAPVNLIEAQWRDHILAARTEFLTLPATLASEIHALYQVAIDPDLILSRIETALQKLEHYEADDDIEPDDDAADDEVDPPDDEGGSEGVGAPAEDEDRGVGDAV